MIRICFNRSRKLRAWITALAAAAVFLSTNFAYAIQDGSTIQPKLDFARDIQPIFEAKCIRCHGHDLQEGDYRLDLKADALGMASTGERPIKPGKADESYLVELISGDEPEMPAEGDRLTSNEVAAIRQWVDEGAVWPDEHAGNSNNSKSLWSIQPLYAVPTPVVNGDTGSSNPIDAFVHQKLVENGLSMSKPADKRMLIRRLFLDVGGLPPTPEMVSEFERDAAPDAYEKLVDRVLTSPHYGERWARHWLDVVRFAESNGFETNVERPAAFHYRDWVIEALNCDMPFNQFAAAQIAGDQLGHDAATGFLVAGAWDEVKSPDVNLTLMQREDELADMVGTTSTAFLGLTLACARCHQHKFDPLEQADYFAMKAILAGVQHGVRSIKTEGTEELTAELDATSAKRVLLRGQTLKFEPLAQIDLPPAEPQQEFTSLTLGATSPARPQWARIETDVEEFPQPRAAVNARENVDRFVAQKAKFVRFIVKETNQSEPCLDELEIWGSTKEEEPWKLVGSASDGATVTSSGDYPDRSKHRLEQINDGRYGNDFSWISNEIGSGWVQIELSQPTRIECVVWGRDRLGAFADRLPTSYEIQVAAKPGQWVTVATGADRLKPGETINESPDTRLAEAELAQRTTLFAAISAIDATLTNLQLRLSLLQTAYAGNFTSPPEIHRLYRGEPQSPREVVKPDIPKILGTLELPDSPSESERRLAYAKWLASDSNTLAARVIVNRVWQHHFGRGIVRTPSDFGAKGAPPTHPELLDWLAQELIANSWSLKHMHRLILTSDAYCQSDLPNDAAAQIDSDCHLIWRFPPRRMEAEAIRDSILAVSGRLDLKMGGPGFSVFEPNSNYVRVYNPKQSFGPAEFRRMIYMTRIRMEQDATFGAFDGPDGGLTCPVRSRSTTPLQALHLLNSPFVLQQADLFAARLQREAGDDRRSQIERAFVLALGRPPLGSELGDSLSLVEQFGLAALCRALFNANEFLIIP